MILIIYVGIVSLTVVSLLYTILRPCRNSWSVLILQMNGILVKYNFIQETLMVSDTMYGLGTIYCITTTSIFTVMNIIFVVVIAVNMIISSDIYATCTKTKRTVTIICVLVYAILISYMLLSFANSTLVLEKEKYLLFPSNSRVILGFSACPIDGILLLFHLIALFILVHLPMVKVYSMFSQSTLIQMRSGKSLEFLINAHKRNPIYYRDLKTKSSNG